MTTQLATSGQRSGRMRLRAISSAVEHLPYKEIVTGSIPVSPILQARSYHWVFNYGREDYFGAQRDEFQIGLILIFISSL